MLVSNLSTTSLFVVATVAQGGSKHAERVHQVATGSPSKTANGVTTTMHSAACKPDATAGTRSRVVTVMGSLPVFRGVAHNSAISEDPRIRMPSSGQTTNNCRQVPTPVGVLSII